MAMVERKRKISRDCVMTQSVDGRVITETTSKEFKVPVEPDFVKLYTDDIANMNNINGHKRDVLCFMAGIMDYNNVAVVSPAMRKRWAAELEVSMSTINNAVSGLKKEGHILSHSPGEYIINPCLFAKGEWKNTVKKRESYDAYFVVRYKIGKGGYTRTYRETVLQTIATDTGGAS